MVLGGALVGYVTNWIALKWIFEPLNPVSVGPFVLQGMFLKRQLEVNLLQLLFKLYVYVYIHACTCMFIVCLIDELLLYNTVI